MPHSVDDGMGPLREPSRPRDGTRNSTARERYPSQGFEDSNLTVRTPTPGPAHPEYPAPPTEPENAVKIGPIRKAVVSALVTGTAALALVGADGAITLAEALAVVAATAASAGAVYGVRNA